VSVLVLSHTIQTVPWTRLKSNEVKYHVHCVFFQHEYVLKKQTAIKIDST